MKVKANLTNQTLECLDNKPYIQGYDTRNKLIVYVDASVTLTNIQIAYQLQNGRNTIKLPNNGVVEATLEDETTPNPDYIEGYNGFIFNAFTNAGEPLAVTNQAGNFTATVVFNVSGNTYKLNVLNTVLKSTDFEEFESAVEGVAQEVLFSLESMSDIVTELQQTIDEIAANDFSEADAKEIFYTKTQSDSKYAKFKLITNIANIPAETLASLEVGDILVSSGYAYMVLKGLQAQNSAYNRFIYGIEDTNKLKVYWYEKTSVGGTAWYLRTLTYPLAYSSTDKLNADYIEDGSTNKVFTGTEKTKLSGIETGAQVNIIEGVKVNGTSQTPTNKIINITIPTQASDVNALPNSTKYCASCDLGINPTTYVMSLQLKDQDGNNLGTAKTIDLPLESVVVSGSYDSATKKVILTLQNGSTIEFSVADLVSGLQTEITAQNKLSSDLVDDIGHTNKFVTADEKSVIDNIGYLDLSSMTISEDSSNPTSLTNNQVAEINKKYCIIKYFNKEFYKCNNDNNATTKITFSKIQNDFVTYQTQGTVTRYKMYYYALIVDTSAKTIYLNTDDKADFYSKTKVDDLLDAKADKSELDSVPTTTDTVANTVEVPSSAKGLATLKQIGGMSYKCNQLLNVTSVTSASATGNLTFSVSNGVITINGTSGSNFGYYKIDTVTLNGTYYISGSEVADGVKAYVFSSELDYPYNTSFTTTGSYDIYIEIEPNKTYNNFKLYPMLNTGTTAQPYEAYYEGIHDSAVTKVESVGVNLWDEVWEVGTYDANGDKATSEYALRSKNYIRVSPNTSYYYKVGTGGYLVICYYDINKNFIERLYGYSRNEAYTTPSNCAYIRFSVISSYGSTYNHDICINKSNSAINGQYFAYKKYTLDIPSGARVERGINENCYDYIEFLENGKKYKHEVIDDNNLGNNTYTMGNRNNDNTGYIFYCSFSANATTENSLCAYLNRGNLTGGAGWESLKVNEYWLNGGYLAICYDSNSASDFKTAMNNKIMLFKADQETITDISDILTEQHLPIEAGGTLELVNEHNNAVPVQVSFDNGLVDMVKTNHNHDIEQQKQIEKLEETKQDKLYQHLVTFNNMTYSGESFEYEITVRIISRDATSFYTNSVFDMHKLYQWFIDNGYDKTDTPVAKWFRDVTGVSTHGVTSPNNRKMITRIIADNTSDHNSKAFTVEFNDYIGTWWDFKVVTYEEYTGQYTENARVISDDITEV